MRSLIVSIAVAVLIIAALFAVPHSQAEVKPARVAPPSWEYKVVYVGELIGEAREVDEVTAALEKHLNSLGNDGWEFCQEVNRGWIFKRPR